MLFISKSAFATDIYHHWTFDECNESNPAYTIQSTPDSSFLPYDGKANFEFSSTNLITSPYKCLTTNLGKAQYLYYNSFFKINSSSDPNSNFFKGFKNLTISMNIFPVDFFGTILSKYEKGKEDKWLTTTSDGRVVFYLAGTCMSGFLYSNKKLIKNRLSSIVVTLDSQYIRLYIDGVLDISAPVAITNCSIKDGSGNFYIGRDPVRLIDQNAGFFQGYIDDVKIYNRALSAQEITALQPTLSALQIKVFLAGPYNTTTGLMKDSLRTGNLLPISQPYSISPFNYNGSERLLNNLLLASDNTAIVDWILVELRSKLDGKTVISRKAALVQRNGIVVDASTGSPLLVFNNISNTESYYVTVRHRNHLGIMTKTPVSLINGDIIDFTTPSTLTYGDNATYIKNNIAMMWSGDINQDNKIINAGPVNDVNVIAQTVLLAPNNTTQSTNYIVSGYLPTDLNFDGATIYQGPGNDTNAIMSSVLLHPQNTNYNSNYIIQGQLP